MPVRDAVDAPASRQMLTLLFWLGVGLAAIGAPLLLIARGSGPLRTGAVLSVLGVVLIGLSITLRGTSRARPDLQESLLDQIEGVRGELHTDLGAATQATQRMLGEQLRSLQDEVYALRAALGASHTPAVGGPAPPDRDHPDVSRHSGGSRHGANSRHHGMPTGQYAESAGYSGASARVYGAPAGPAGNPDLASVPEAASRASSGRAVVPPAPASWPGVVRHTETFQVMTRQTIVEPEDARSEPGYRAEYDDRSEFNGAGSGWTAPRQRRRPAEPDADRFLARPEPDADRFLARPEPDRGPAQPEVEGVAQPGDGSWHRAERRWAGGRNDHGGREVRIGQRRAAVRADQTGTELRFEDRWAAVREEPDRSQWNDGDEPSRRWVVPAGRSGWLHSGDGRWPDRAEGAPEWADSEDLSDQWADARGSEDWSAADGGELSAAHQAEWADGQHVPAALPAGRAADSWRQRWSEPEREPVRRGRRYRDDNEPYGFPPSDGAPRAGGRQVSFGRSDAGWG